MLKHPILFLLHLSLFLILCGFFLTFMTSKKGILHLKLKEPMNSFVDDKSNMQQFLPFYIILSDFQIVSYPGTQTPSDFVSYIKLKDNEKEIIGQISMNKILSYNGYRFYLSRYDTNKKGVLLIVKTDRYGLPIVSFGGILLLISMIGFFFSKNTKFRVLLEQLLQRKDWYRV